MMNRPLFRPDPLLPVTQMVTHAIVAPLVTHWRKATCEEIGCLHFHHGWAFHTAGMSPKLLAAAKTSGRQYRVERHESGETWVFEPGQPCFRASEHRIRLDREELFIRRSGDWRGNPDGRGTKPLIFSGADAWKDSLGTTLDHCRG
jgi:hypothetical protein